MEEDSLDAIWSDDLFNRKEEAQHLIAYVESVTGRPQLREDKRAYTIAIEAGYGEGKSFFLKRLARTMALNHPVALVDAWADDLADEPLTALVATLKSALEPLMEDRDVKSRFASFMGKTGQVAKIASMGLLKRGLSLALTTGAVDAAEQVLMGLSEDVKDAATDGLAEAAKGSVDDTSAAISSISNTELMSSRVAQFELGRAAIFDLKKSLEALVASLDQKNLNAPIVIIVDELDRCRPTYAVKLLEEIKHLFDVPGLAFILGVHTDQLGRSIAGAYGAEFDGRAYLRRFIDRHYRLAQPDLSPLLEALCTKAGNITGRFDYPALIDRDGDRTPMPLPQLLATMMDAYGFAARDAFELVDILQTCAALARSSPKMTLPYLLPLIFGQMRSCEPGTLATQVKKEWSFGLQRDNFGRDMEVVSFEALALRYQNAASADDEKLRQKLNQERVPPEFRKAASDRDQEASGAQWTIRSYPRLITTVGRFSLS